jgi:FAD binding domain/Ig-like domain from next to BRCA1 gene/PASTA domain
MAAMAGLTLTIDVPSERQEFPPGADVIVAGVAVGTGGVEPHPIESVTVQLGGQPAVNADLTRGRGPQPPFLTVGYTTTVRMGSPGVHQVSVTAADDIGRSVTKTVRVATTGMPNCQPGLPWSNYARTQSTTPAFTCAPVSLPGLVAVVREAEAVQQQVHAFGSRWSFSDCALTGGRVVDTAALSRPVQTVQAALRSQQSPPLFHVEAGIQIDDLSAALDRLGLALETMGGASGQSLAGAISTGTHGGDKFLPPLADSVLALHLVGVGGTQHWIEPSDGITDPVLLRQHVVPDVEPQNIVYDDATFNACLVSLGCMGIIYAVVLRVRDRYDLVETTAETSWRVFKARASTVLNDPSNRFLQVVLNPYRDADADNLCLVTTRSEADHTGPVLRPRGDVESAVRAMIDAMDLLAWIKLLLHGVFGEDPSLTAEERLAKVVQGVLTHAPDQRPVMVEHYGNIMREVWPSQTFRGSSYSVMDIGYRQPSPASQAVFSIELFFPSVGDDGRLGFADFIDALISVVNNATDTFFTGYVSLRFTGPTRALLGMQRWRQTCSVEISLLQGVQGLDELIARLYRIGYDRGALPHWGQMVDLGVQGYGGRYPGYALWRQVYGRMSRNFAAQTFANQLSTRWNLTTRNAAEFVSQTVGTAMVAGGSQSVQVTMRNTGTTTWTAAGSYRLGSQSPQDNTVWGSGRQSLPADVAPGATATFQFTITAPAEPGSYQFQWRMLEELVEWFGDFTPRVGIGVGPPAGQTIVPLVLEMRPARAEQTLRDAGLVASFAGPSGSDAWVASQSPRADEVVPTGTTVRCQLRRGPIP